MVEDTVLHFYALPFHQMTPGHSVYHVLSHLEKILRKGDFQNSVINVLEMWVTQGYVCFTVTD